MSLVALLALAAMPLVVLRGRTLAGCYLAFGTFSGAIWLLKLRHVALEPLLALAIFAVFLACGAHVRWSAGRAALLALLMYALAIPLGMQHEPNGDEDYYLLIAESLARDFDLDLANQYRAHEMEPQLGDPVGANGEQYSRHEPFLAVLLIPGWLLAGLHGALATIALFGALLVRSTFRWMDDEGISEAAQRAVFPFFALAPPVLFYATRIWPEVPAAFFFVEALRGARNRRTQRLLPALFGLVMLKLRFVLVALGVLFVVLVERRASARRIGFALLLIAAPLLVLWLITGNPLNVHTWEELLLSHPSAYAKGFFGLLLDGAAGIAFQAPFYLLALFAITRWRETPHGFRAGLLAAALYILYLLPRGEWHGGWSPPLRYLVFLMPVLALGAASVWHRVNGGVIALISVWTIGVAIHGLRNPNRLFRIANGENAVGEFLSEMYRADFSRMFPSFIRVNDAALIASIALLALLAVARFARVPSQVVIALSALAIAQGFVIARQPASTIHFEDAHVEHHHGALYPEQYTPMRFAYRGGWILQPNDALAFLAREGPHTLHYISGPGALIELGGRAYHLAPTERFTTARVFVPASGRVTIHCIGGAVNLERMDHE